MSDTFLQLDSSAWTAIGTLTLAVITGLYVFVTWKIARSAATSAESSKVAAEAAAHSAKVAEAGLVVDFEVAYQQVIGTSGPWITVECKSARVYLHRAELTLLVFKTPGDDSLQGVSDPTPLEVVHPKDLPTLLHVGESVSFSWAWAKVDPAKGGGGNVRIDYSIGEEGAIQSIRRSFAILAQEGAAPESG